MAKTDAKQAFVIGETGRRNSNWLRRFVIREIGAVVGTIVLFLFFTVMIGSNWVNLLSIKSILDVVAQLGVMTIGESLLIISGEFDLSVGSLFGFAGTLFIILMAAGLTPVESFLLVLAMAALVGLFNATLTLRGQIPSLIVTLGSLFIFRGLVYYGTSGFPITLPAGLSHNFLVNALGGSFWLNNSLIWLLVLTVVFSFVLTRTVFGNRAFAVGGDSRSAWAQGVPVNRIKTYAFIISSVMAALAGMMATAELGSATTTLGESQELSAIASCVVGGVLLTGGVGSIWGAIVGAAMLSMISNGLVMMGAPPYWFITFVGIILIIGVLTNNGVYSWMKKGARQ